MAAATGQDFTTYKGDSVYPIFTVVDATGAVVDLSTVDQITWIAKSDQSEDADDVTLTLTSGGIVFVTDGTDGKFEVQLTDTYTDLMSGYYSHKATIVDELGNPTTVSVGRFQVGVRPSWSYNAAQIGSVPLFQVRRLLGDVIENDPQIPDQEILFAITQRSTIYGAAADCAGYISAQYSRKVDSVVPGQISTKYSQQAKYYADLQARLNQQARDRGAGAYMFAGGISVQSKLEQQANTDRVRPAFSIAFTDNENMPLPSIGNEQNATGI